MPEFDILRYSNRIAEMFSVCGIGARILFDSFRGRQPFQQTDGGFEVIVLNPMFGFRWNIWMFASAPMLAGCIEGNAARATIFHTKINVMNSKK